MLLLTSLLWVTVILSLSDQEPAILAFKAAVIRRLTAIEGEGMQIIPEVSPVGESQSDGDVESAVKQVQGHFRTLRLHLQARYQEIIPDNHPVLAWLITHAALTLNRYQIGPDGRTPRQRLKGRSFNRESLRLENACGILSRRVLE